MDISRNSGSFGFKPNAGRSPSVSDSLLEITPLLSGAKPVNDARPRLLAKITSKMRDRAKGKLLEQLSEAQAKVAHHSELVKIHERAAEEASKMWMERSKAGDEADTYTYSHNAGQSRKRVAENSSSVEEYSAEIKKIEAKLARLNQS